MSHDRGCWKCGEDPSTYATCASAACPKRDHVFRTTTRIKPPALDIVDDRAAYCSGCRGFTVHHTCGKLPDADAVIEDRFHNPKPGDRRAEIAKNGYIAKRPTCHSCGREQPLWSNCFRLAAECPVRAAFAPGRPATRIISVNEPGYEIVMFFNPDGSAQAVISRPGGKDPIDVLIAAPIIGRRIVVERKGDAFAVSYKDVQP